MTRHPRRKAPCPDCGREVSCSMIDPMTGPLVWRRHRCVGGELREPQRAAAA